MREDLKINVLKDLPGWIEADSEWGLRLKQAIDRLSGVQMTYAEFLEWADEDTLAEWVNGEVIMSSPANRRHQDIAGFLESLMRLFIETHQLGVVCSAPFQMKLSNSGREPDLLFVANDHLARLRKTYLDGPADLVVEIISPESAGRDRGDKFYEYAQGGVPEYWLIDPQLRWAEFYHLKGIRYHLAFSGETGKYRALNLPDFWLRVEWLWQDTLPLVDDVLLEVGGKAYALRWIERLKQGGFLE
ncbi:MAG TPA: Uma2 family endonuclease [Chloroflexi bacterium]|nr:Uma2 family endonuclease [Chloroflexota bacterium]